VSSLNKVLLIGNLGKDPEIRMTQGGNKSANFSIATSESWTSKQTGQRETKTEWHNVVFWGNVAEVAEKYLKKGSKVYIEGKLQTRKWQDKSGTDRWTTEVLGSQLVMLDRKEASQDSAPEKISDDIPFDDELPI